MSKLPSWLRRPLPLGSTHNLRKKTTLLSTVCQEANCPNRFECFAKKRAAFLALGKECTRNCAFCSVAHNKNPLPPDTQEPYNIAKATEELGLTHTVVTMVTRDDLPDEGATHIAAIIKAVKTTIEVLVSDFSGRKELLNIIFEQQPEIFNHNIETTKALSPKLRDKALYSRSLQVLAYAKEKGMTVKSGFMVGLGENKADVYQTIQDLQQAGCDIITIGQYLQPNSQKYPVKNFIPPADFQDYTCFGNSIGVKYMHCAPLVRSSYNSEKIINLFAYK